MSGSVDVGCRGGLWWGPVQYECRRSASCGGVRGEGEGERLESPGGSGEPGGMLCRMARFLLESVAVGLMRYCPGSPGAVVTN